MRFLVDAMLPPRTATILNARGHDAVSPADLGAANLPDTVLIHLASEQGRLIVTENARHFADVTTCPVLFVLKVWWPRKTLAADLALALDRWAVANPDPGYWSHWLDAEFR